MLRCNELLIRQDAFHLSAQVSFDPGVMTALVGPSGGGKSTFLSALAGFLRPSEGQITWNGVDITGLPPAKRPISVLFQDNNLFPHLTIAQNAGLGLRPKLRLTEAERDAVNTVLDQVGLKGFEDRKPGALSGGQQSRAALARVLMADRPVVLLDEPFSALGPGMKKDMLHLVQEQLIGRGRTVIMVTHDPQDALETAGKTALVADHTVTAPADTQALFNAPPPALKAYLSQT